jgi:GNAT superfamily N-acetyltransferase
MLRYTRRGVPDVPTTEGVSFARWTGGDGPDEAFRELESGDEALVALCEGRYAGRVFLSDRPVFVPAIDQRVDREGAYVWRLFVDPAFRGRGVATALVARGLELARERFGTEGGYALVARDNYPSRLTFEGCGFRATGRVDYLRVRRWSRRNWREVDESGT